MNCSPPSTYPDKRIEAFALQTASRSHRKPVMTEETKLALLKDIEGMNADSLATLLARRVEGHKESNGAIIAQRITAGHSDSSHEFALRTLEVLKAICVKLNPQEMRRATCLYTDDPSIFSMLEALANALSNQWGMMRASEGQSSKKVAKAIAETMGVICNKLVMAFN